MNIQKKLGTHYRIGSALLRALSPQAARADLCYCHMPNILALLMEQEPQPMTLTSGGGVSRGQSTASALKLSTNVSFLLVPL